jgi:hypothetical protein
MEMCKDLTLYQGKNFFRFLFSSHQLSSPVTLVSHGADTYAAIPKVGHHSDSSICSKFHGHQAVVAVDNYFSPEKDTSCGGGTGQNRRYFSISCHFVNHFNFLSKESI